MSDAFRLDDNATPAPPAPQLAREAAPPRRDRLLVPLVAAGCALAGVALGFVLGQRAALSRAETDAMVAPRLAREHVLVPDFDDGRVFAFNFEHGDGHRRFAPMPHLPPLPPAPPPPLMEVHDRCEDGEAGCTTIVKRKPDGSMVIVTTRK